MDLMMPVLSGSEATRLITAEDSAENKKPRVLIFTSYGTSADLTRAVINGATGVLLKNAPTHDPPQAIRRVFAGEMALPGLSERQLKQLELAARGRCSHAPHRRTSFRHPLLAT
jgi:DNA-binding NarL/FixJ family response regulator